MERWVYGYRTVRGNPEQLQKRLRTELPALLARAAGHAPNPPAGDGSFLLNLSGRVAGAHAHKTVRVRIGVATHSGDGLAIPISWEAHPRRQGFPPFDGMLEIEPHSAFSAELALVGVYSPPGGPLGVALDVTAMHGLAQGSISELVDGLAAALTDPQAPPVAVSGDTPMRVRKVMTPDPLILHEAMPLRTAALLLFHFEIGGAPVQDSDGRLLGVLSEADLLEKEAAERIGFGRAAARSRRFRSAATVGDACTRPARVTDADTTLQDAAREMLDHRVARLVVLDDTRIAGIVSRHDVLQALFRVDSHIDADAKAVLSDMDEPHVHVQVEFGEITATGAMSRLSRIKELANRLQRIDGAMGVDVDALEWHTDDVTLVDPVF